MQLGPCQNCGGSTEQVSLEKPVDYEYGVVPERGYHYRRCQSCATEWLCPRPTIAELPGFYPEKYHAHNDDHGWIAGLLVALRGQLRGRSYRKFLVGKKSGALFDVGAGDCRHFEELRQFADWQFSGVEIQPPVAEAARAAGYDIETGTLEEMDLSRHSGRYDVVSMNHVLEHVLDPGEVVARCHRLLKPGAYLVGQLPTNSAWEAGFGASWAGYHYPRHLQVFSREGLRQLIEKQGFVDVEISSAPHCQTAISMQNFLLAAGWKLKLEYGRTPIYGTLLMLSLPFELLAWLFNRSGTINFYARKGEIDQSK